MRPLPRVLAVTDSALCARDDFPVLVAAILSAGSGVAVVVRAPGTSVEARRGYFERVRALARPTEAATIAHDDFDLGRLAQGVQFDSVSTDLGLARRQIGTGWIGVSVSSHADAIRAVDAGADYLVAGPIFTAAPTPDPAGWGLGLLDRIATLGPPVFACGGITVERIADVRRTAAWGIAAKAALFQAGDPARAVVQLLAEWEKPEPPVPSGHR